MYTIQKHVGRLVESVMQSKVTRADLESAERSMAAIADSLPGPCVVIADYRETRFMLEEDAAHFAAMLRRYNDRIERSAMVVSASSAVGVLQSERVVRETGHPLRRAFRDPHDAAAWLNEALTPAEQERLRVVLKI